MKSICLKTLGIFFALLLHDATPAWARVDAQPIQQMRRFDYQRELKDWDLFTAVEYSPTVPNTFFSALRSGELCKWLDTDAAAKWKVVVDAPNGEIEDMKISHDGRLLGVVGGPAYIRLLDADSGAALATDYRVGDLNPLPVAPHFTSLAFSPTGQHFAVGDANGHIYIWSMTDPQALAVLKSADQPIKQLTFSRSGEFLVSANNKEILIWNWAREEVAVHLSADIASGPFWAESVYLPAFERIMVITTFHDIVLYDLSARAILKRYPLAQGDDDDEPGDPLLTVTDQDMTHLWRFYKQPLVEHLDLETGEATAAYIDPTIVDGGGLGMSAYVHISRKPKTVNEFVAGVLTWKFDIFKGTLTMLTGLRFYRLPL